MIRISNHLHNFLWDVTTHPCHGISSGLTKPPKKLKHECVMIPHCLPGPQFKIKMTSYQYRKSQCGDKTILRPSYLHNGISYTGKTTPLYWIGAQGVGTYPYPNPDDCLSNRCKNKAPSGLWVNRLVSLKITATLHILDSCKFVHTPSGNNLTISTHCLALSSFWITWH